MGDDLNEMSLGAAPGQGSQIGAGPTAARRMQKDTTVDLPSAASETYSRVGLLDVTPIASGLTSNVDGFGRRETFTGKKRVRFATREGVEDNEDDNGDGSVPVGAIIAVVVFLAVIACVMWAQWSREGELLRADPQAYERMQAEREETARYEIVGDGVLGLVGSR